MAELLKLDWKTRINALDAMEHPYFKAIPLPAKPHEIPTFEESHELDRRKFHDRKANLPAAPRGGTVGVGPDVNGATAGFNSGDGFNGRNGMNGSRHRAYDERRPGWRDRGPRPPPGDRPYRDDGDRAQRNRPAPRGGPDGDTYIPSYQGEVPPRRRDDRPREDRRDDWRSRGGRDDRRNDRDARDRRTRSRSRSPIRDKPRDRDRERDRDPYRR